MRFDVMHFGFTKYDGEFRKISGTLAFDPANPDNSKVEITIATDSVLVPNAKLNEELDVLDAAKFPQITFKVAMTGADTADVTCDAVGTNPVRKHYTSGFEATGKIMRTEFGMKTYAPMISDAVDIDNDAAFEKAK